MVSLYHQIEQKLCERFSPSFIKLEDESSKHVGHLHAHPSQSTHFRVCLVSEAFADCSKVTRHRMIYSALEDLWTFGLHALAIEAYNPTEYESIQNDVAAS